MIKKLEIDVDCPACSKKMSVEVTKTTADIVSRKCKCGEEFNVDVKSTKKALLRLSRPL